jgi:hypothetical protein
MSAAILRTLNKQKIALNPFSLSGDLYPLIDNGHGRYNENKNAVPEVKTYTNNVRISFTTKSIRKIENGSPIYIQQRVYFMISDYETIVDNRLEFDYYGVMLKVIQRRDLRKDSSLIGYEYELKELTEAVLYA